MAGSSDSKAGRLGALADGYGWSQDLLTTTMGRLARVVPDDEPAPQLPERYEDLGLLGRGGQGSVRLVCDHHLGRLAAFKLLARVDSPEARSLFLAESRTTARLEHPGIVPIYDRGTTADGCPWYAMRYVEGRSLERALLEGSLPRRRLVEILLRVSEAVAYAHHNGVVHLDLKPANVLLGPFGEVLVTDWGLAQPVGELAEEAAVRGAGTPAYMPPEQKVGSRAIRPTADVFALGSTLLQLLTDRLPEAGEVPHQAGPLWDLVRAARAWFPEERPADAAAFAWALRRWLDGQARRAAALALVAEAERRRPEIEDLRTAAAQAAAQARSAGVSVPSHAPVAARREAWAKADEAAALQRQVRRLELARWGLLQRALEEAPDSREPRAALVQHHRQGLLAAEAAGDEAGVDTHTAALQGLDPEGQADWLRGDGRLRLVTDPPATARLFALEARDRRLVAVPLRSLGRTPIDIPLARGRYVVSLRAPGRAPVEYPVHISRGQIWDGVPPDAESPLAVPLPPLLGPDEIYVPPGWFLAGGDPQALDALPRWRIWADGFVIARHPVTNREYLTWLNGLVAAGEGEAALAHAPSGGEGSPYRQRESGRFTVHAEAMWRLDGPVLRVSPRSAEAYAAWRAAQDGVPWRLPHALEWEKAARGVDGRAFSMGDWLTPAHANMNGSLPGPAEVRAVGEFPLDRSPYGVMGLSGNVRDICGSRYVRGGRGLDGQRLDPVAHAGGGELYEVRGGCFSGTANYCRAAGRFAIAPDGVSFTSGFRLARSWPG
ncbi:MAG: SUMF1/EgtB/PvdO family nonheme iron enzyme [Myxococcales bacterium]|nr:SUMF1/EgtB/PvdO family nonheme iron enzyme [Myxococcales bacterium]